MRPPFPASTWRSTNQAAALPFAGVITSPPRSGAAAFDHLAEPLPDLAVPARQLLLPDRMVVGRAGIDADAGQQGGRLEIVQGGRLLQDVLAREIVVALLQHLQHRLR